VLERLCETRKLIPIMSMNSVSKVRNQSLVILITSIALVMTASAKANITYDANIDFGSTNPNGVWSYGYASQPDLGSAFIPFDIYVTTLDILEWHTTSIENIPSIWKNISEGLIVNVPPNTLALHPGPHTYSLEDPYDLHAILRFTAPITGVYETAIQFFAGDTGDTDALILLNNDISNPLFYAPTTDINPQFIDTLTLSAGDTIDIVVGPKGFAWNDSTPIDAVFTVPEPSTYALLLLSAAASLWALKRRKT
jgi:hypothetical protein